MPKNVVPFGELGLIMMLRHSSFASSIYKNFATHKNMQHITYVLEAYCFLLTCQFVSEMLCIVSSTFMTMENILVNAGAIAHVQTL